MAGRRGSRSMGKALPGSHAGRIVHGAPSRRPAHAARSPPMLSSRGPAARISVAALLLAGTFEEVLFLANPAQATARFYADELAKHPDYLAGVGRAAMIPVALGTATELATAVLGLFIVWR